MDESTVIKVEGLYKKFSRSLRRGMAYGTIDMLRNFVGLSAYNKDLRRSEFWALEDINFEVKKGEAVGIIGMNGSGKSTLLRLLTGIFPPDRGKIVINGTIGALISVGAGFHPHMTGRENIYLNGTILGMTKKEIDSKFHRIIEFAEIGPFLDAPVSTYSSGMRVRLGFAIAIHCEPDILLVDEILSVGDLSFRNKSLRYMSEFRKKANALLFVSHDIEQVRNLCNRVIIIDKGKIQYDGPTHEGIIKFEEMGREYRVESIKVESNRFKHIRDFQGDETIEFIDIGLVDVHDNKVEILNSNDPLIISCAFKVKKPISSIAFYLSVTRDDNPDISIINVVSNDQNKYSFKNLQIGEYKVKLLIKDHHLSPGVYNPNIGFRNDETYETYQKVYTNIVFSVKSSEGKLERGVINVDEKWDLQKL